MNKRFINATVRKFLTSHNGSASLGFPEYVENPFIPDNAVFLYIRKHSAPSNSLFDFPKTVHSSFHFLPRRMYINL